MTVYLERITVRFPSDDTEFTNDLLSLLDVLGRHEKHVLRLTRSVLAKASTPRYSWSFNLGTQTF
jgi:hypothetical protein